MTRDELIRTYKQRLHELRVNQLTEKKLPVPVYEIQFYMYTVFIRDLQQLSDDSTIA